MFYRHRQNIITGDGSSAIRLNSFKHSSRFLFVGILKEIGIHFATKKAASDNIKRVLKAVDCQLLSPIVAGVSSQSDQVPSVVEMVMSKQNSLYLFLFGQRTSGGNSTGIQSQNTV